MTNQKDAAYCDLEDEDELDKYSVCNVNEKKIQVLT